MKLKLRAKWKRACFESLNGTSDHDIKQRFSLIFLRSAASSSKGAKILINQMCYRVQIHVGDHRWTLGKKGHPYLPNNEFATKVTKIGLAHSLIGTKYKKNG